jgi:hypothetical protein
VIRLAGERCRQRKAVKINYYDDAIAMPLVGLLSLEHFALEKRGAGGWKGAHNRQTQIAVFHFASRKSNYRCTPTAWVPFSGAAGRGKFSLMLSHYA